MRIFKTDIDENQSKKCKSKGCENRRHKRDHYCQYCGEGRNVIKSAKRNNIGNKIWTVYRIDLNSYVYYGCTGTTLKARASTHSSHCEQHPDSYVHQQIKERKMTGPEVFALMTPIIVTDRDYAIEVESILIRESSRYKRKVCNDHKRFIPIAA